MSGSDAVVAFLGGYLAVALLIAAWQHASERGPAVGVWVAFLGAWSIAARARWLPDGTIVLLLTLVAWGLVTLLLISGGRALARGRPVRGLIWLLGPVHALALLASWISAARERARARPAPAAQPAPAAVAGEALESVVELGETSLEEVMVPRSEIVALPEDAVVGDWLEKARQARRSRLLVYGEDLDEIRGFLDTRDLYPVPDLQAPVRDFLRQARFVPESMRCDDLLRELISQEEEIAIVVDEFGGTAGLVTTQDLFEILLGEIDQEGAALGLRKLGAGRYLADGSLRIDDFVDFFGMPLPEGDYETLAGIMLDRLGRIPSQGERVEVEGVALEAAAVSARRILRVRVELPPAAHGVRSPGRAPRRTGGV